jgi:hypothetical protein
MAVSQIWGQFAFAAEGLCMTRDMLATRWGPVTLGEDFQAWIWLPSSVFDSGKHPDGSDLVEVEHFVIEVETGAPALQRRQPFTGSDPSPPTPETAALLDSLSETASAIARQFLAWVRLRLRQYWVAPTGTPIPFESRLSDADSGDAIAVRAGSLGRPIPFTMFASLPGGGSALTSSSLLGSLPDILAGETAHDGGLPERLLSSAFGKLWSAYPDPQTAVFLAVTACETKVKMVLGMQITAGGKPLLHYFDDQCETVKGRSLREDNEPLWDRLRALITARNDVAHRGAEPTSAQAQRHLRARRKITRSFLDSGTLAWYEHDGGHQGDAGGEVRGDLPASG